MNESSTIEIERYRAVLNHILPLAITGAGYGSREWEEAVSLIEAALAQESQHHLNLQYSNSNSMEM